VQLTNYGISGIPVFQISRFAARELDKGKTVTARIDFFPEISRNRLRSMIQSTASEHPDFTMYEVLSGLMNEKMASCMARLAMHGQKNLPASRWDGKSLALLQELLKCHVLEITDTNGFDQAQVCCGGVDTREINPLTMESKVCRGLYLTGELLDVDGICGGFNLHWAFSTGCIAGQDAAKRRKHA
jgi:predicted Rossmann fold flavoprotein